MAVILGCRAPATGGSNVQFTDWGGYLEFIARHREQDQESKVGAGEQSSKETIFEERLQLETEGFVYHPNFLEFWLAGLFGLTVASDFPFASRLANRAATILP